MPLACDLTAIPLAQRVKHAAATARLLHVLADEILPLPDGYRFRFAPEHIGAVAAFVSRERLCCPFLRFTIELSPGHGPLWLTLTGREGVRKFLAAELWIGGDQGGSAGVLPIIGLAACLVPCVWIAAFFGRKWRCRKPASSVADER